MTSQLSNYVIILKTLLEKSCYEYNFLQVLYFLLEVKLFLNTNKLIDDKNFKLFTFNQ